MGGDFSLYGLSVLFFFSFFLNPPPRTCLLALREKGRERNLDQLPPTHVPTRDQTHNLGIEPATFRFLDDIAT